MSWVPPRPAVNIGSSYVTCISINVWKMHNARTAQRPMRRQDGGYARVPEVYTVVPATTWEVAPLYPSVGVLRALHCSAAVLHLVWVGLARSCITSTDIATPVWTQNVTYAAGVDGSYIQYGDRRTIFLYRPMQTLIGFIAITAVAHIFYATLDGAGGKSNMWRWLEYAITATMLTINASIGVGASSVDAFILVMTLSVVMQASGLGLDMVHGSIRRGMKELLLAIGFLCVTALVVVLSWHAHTAVGILVNMKRVASAYGIFYISFGVVGILRAYEVGPLRSSAFTEMVYTLLSLSCKTSMFWLSFGGIRQTLEHLLPKEPSNGVNWALVQDLAAFVPGPIAAALIILAMIAAPRVPGQHSIMSGGWPVVGSLII